MELTEKLFVMWFIPTFLWVVGCCVTGGMIANQNATRIEVFNTTYTVPAYTQGAIVSISLGISGGVLLYINVFFHMAGVWNNKVLSKKKGAGR